MVLLQNDEVKKSWPYLFRADNITFTTLIFLWLVLGAKGTFFTGSTIADNLLVFLHILLKMFLPLKPQNLFL
jgi:hypothetical protein